MAGSRSNYRNNRSNYRNNKFRGSKTEVNRKSVPRISTLNNKIKKLERETELKYHDVQISGNVSTTNAFTEVLNGIGTTSETLPSQTLRDGGEVMATSMQIRCAFTPSADETSGSLIRCIIFWDAQCNGAFPDPAGGFGSDALLNISVVQSAPFAPFMYETQDRFRVLYDKMFVMNPRVISSTEQTGDDPVAVLTNTVIPMNLVWKKKIKLNRKVKYDNNSAAIADIVTNSLIICFVSDVPTENPIQVYAGIRFYFKDA